MANIITGRKSGFIMRSGGRRRETLWLGGTAFSQALGAPTSVALVLVLSAGALALRPFTVIRVRGVLHVRSDQSTAGETWGASFGDAVVSDQASGVGITAVPTPTTDSDSDAWSVYEFMMGHFEHKSSVGFTDVGVNRIIDSKAMRKVEDGQDLVSVVEGPGAGLTASGSVISGFVRTLIKLH